MPSDIPFDADQLRGASESRNMKRESIETDTRQIGRLKGGILIVPKYVIAKTSGEDIDANAEYFVFRVDTDPDAREALWNYTRLVRKVNVKLADDLEKLLSQYEQSRQSGDINQQKLHKDAIRISKNLEHAKPKPQDLPINPLDDQLWGSR